MENNKIKNEPEKLTKSQKKEKIQKYIKQHGINYVLSEMLNTVIHNKEKSPYLYMIKYLGKYISEEDKKKYEIVIPPPYPVGIPIVTFPVYEPECNSLLRKHLDKIVYNLIKFKKTKHDTNINELTKVNTVYPTDKIGLFASEEDCFVVFDELYRPLISDLNHLMVNNKNGFDVENYDFIIEGINEPMIENKIISKMNCIIFKFYRNFSGYPFNLKLSKDGRRDIANITKGKLNLLIEKSILPKGTIFSYGDEKSNSKCEQIITELKYDMDRMKKLNLDKDFPEERYIYESENQLIIILINFMDHLTIYVKNEKTIDIIKQYNQGINIMKYLALQIFFAENEKYGYLTSDLSVIGGAMSIYSSHMIPCELKNKIIDNLTFNEFLQKLRLDKYSISSTNNEEDILEVEVGFKLKYRSTLNFLYYYLYSITGILSVQENKLLSFVDISKTITQPILKAAYKEVYPYLIYQLSTHGENMNDVIKRANDNQIILRDKTEYSSFYPLIQYYLYKTQNFNVDLSDHISKPELANNSNYVSSNAEYFDRMSNLQIVVIRNYDKEGLKFNDVSPQGSSKIISDTIEELNKQNKKTGFATIYEIDNLMTQKQALSLINQNNLPFTIVGNSLEGKAIIKFSEENIYAITNDLDHIKLIMNIVHPHENCINGFKKLIKISEAMCSQVRYVYDKKFGFLTSKLSNVGTGMIAKVDIKVVKIPNEKIITILEKYKKYKEFICIVNQKTNNYSIVQISNCITIGHSEYEIFLSLIQFAFYIIEKDSSYKVVNPRNSNKNIKK